MLGFKNAKAYIYNKGFVTTDIAIENGIITHIGKNLPITKIIECNGMLVPGFIDLHVHGAGGNDCMDSDFCLDDFSKCLVKEGTTCFLATTMTMSEQEITLALTNLANQQNLSGATMLGIHLEGPFISSKFKGAQQEKFLVNPSINLMEGFIKASNNKIKKVTIAPELENANSLIEYLVKQGVKVSIGHSSATFAQVESAVKSGADSITHFYNAQTGLHHREVGVVGAGLLLDELYTEVICDDKHVCLNAIKLLVKSKPKDKVILITDSMRAKYLPEGLSELGGQKVIVKNGEARLQNGTLAGSILKMNEAIKYLVQNNVVSLQDAINFATINPAKSIGMDKVVGKIAKGYRADFTILDENFNVLKTIAKGNVVYEKL